jgi:hypothetical protein
MLVGFENSALASGDAGKRALPGAPFAPPEHAAAVAAMATAKPNEETLE